MHPIEFQRPHAGGARCMRGFPSQLHTSPSYYRHGEVYVWALPFGLDTTRAAGRGPFAVMIMSVVRV